MNKFLMMCTCLSVLFGSTELSAYTGQEYDASFIASISKEEGREWKIWSQDVDSDDEGYIAYSPDPKNLNQNNNHFNERFEIQYMEYLFDGISSHMEGSLINRLDYKHFVDKQFESIPEYHFEILESTYKNEQEGDYVIFTIHVPVPVDGDPPFWSIVKITFHDSLAKTYTYTKNEKRIQQSQFDTWIERIRSIL